MSLLSRVLLLPMVVIAASGVQAMEVATDDVLSDISGGAGMTISITPPAAGIVAQNLYYHDANVAGGGAGIPASLMAGYANQGDLAFANIGIQGCANATTGITCTTPAGATFAVDVDATGDIDTVTAGNQAALRLNIAWAAGIGKMRFKTTKLSLRNATGAITTDILNSVNGYVDMIPASGTPTLTVLLGNEQLTGHMMTFSNANFGTLDFGTLQVLDNSGGAGRNMNFGFQMENVDLSGATVDVTASALVMTAPSLTGLNLALRNIIVGNTTTTMGSLGILGLNISNMTISVAGKI